MTKKLNVKNIDNKIDILKKELEAYTNLKHQITKDESLEKLKRRLNEPYKPKDNKYIPYNEFMGKLKQIKQSKKTLSKLDKLLNQIESDNEIINYDEYDHKIQLHNNELIKNQIINQKEKIKPKKIDYFFENKINFQLKLKSTFEMRNNLGLLYNYSPNVDLGVNDNTNNGISETIFKEYNKLVADFEKVFKGGYEMVMKLIFKSSDPGNTNHITLVLRTFSLKTILQTIKNKIIDRHHNQNSGEINIFIAMTIFVFTLPEKGGCSNCEKIHQKIKYKERTVKIISPKSSNNNCLFMCFCYSLKLNGNSFNFKKVRKELELEPDEMIKIDDVKKVAKYFNTGYILLNQKQEIISYHDLENQPSVHIMLFNNHYYSCKYIDYNKCNHCNTKLLENNTTHICNIKRITYYQNQLGKKNDFVSMINPSSKGNKKIDDDKMIFFDLETFQESINHIPYACGYSLGNSKDVKISYGKNCMNDFINHILSVTNKFICAYNGSGFDFYILLSCLKDKNIEIKNLILSNGAVLSFQFNGNKVFDLYRFINSSLDSACESYQIENKKMKIDILRIQSWELSEKYKNDIVPYLKYDVLSMSELFFKFNNNIYEMDQVNITQFITLSNMAYSLWQKSLKDLIEIPDLEKYSFEKKATFGARCYPNSKTFKSKYYDDIVSGKMKYDELIKTGEYIYNADVKSLYPASMAGFDLQSVNYPTGKSRWSNNPKQEFDNNKLGFFEINFTCPKNIIIPILPRHTINGGLEWSLIDGFNQVYTSVEIKNAIKIGYKIEFINKCLVFDNSSKTVFKPYIDKYMQIKTDGEKEGNEVKRNIGKLMNNAIYGKMLQKSITENTAIINNYNDLLNFFKDYEINDVSALSESKLLLTGESRNKESKITKPAFLGAFILSYSREIMLNYMLAIDPSLKTHVFTYTDTDSLHIIGKYAQKLQNLGMIETKKNASLGYLCSDIKNEGIIIFENNIAPKMYYYESIDNKNDLKLKDLGTMKAKGIPCFDKSKPLKNEKDELIFDANGNITYKRLLTSNLYLNDYSDKDKELTFGGLKRKHRTLTKTDIENGLNHFSIVNNTQTRTFNKTTWTGFDLINNNYYPRGYVFEK